MVKMMGGTGFPEIIAACVPVEGTAFFDAIALREKAATLSGSADFLHDARMKIPPLRPRLVWLTIGATVWPGEWRVPFRLCGKARRKTCSGACPRLEAVPPIFL